MARLLLCAAALSLCLPNPMAAGPDSRPAFIFEPSDVLEVGARVVSSTDLGSTVRITVELSINPKRNVPTARVRGSILNGPGFDEAFGIPDELVTLTKDNPKHQQFELEIAKGQEHRFLFSVGAEDSGTPSTPRSRAYLRVNLDPALEPEQIDGLLQYRANMAGE